MLVNTKQMVIAWSIAAAALWIICSVLVALSPGQMTAMTGHMIHMDIAHTSLAMTRSGFIIGLIAWVVLAASFAWLLGTVYNYVGSRTKSEDDTS